MAVWFLCVTSELWGMLMFFQKRFWKEITIYLTGGQWQRNRNNMSSVVHPHEVSLNTAFCGGLVCFCSCYIIDFVVKRAAYLYHPDCCMAWGDVLYFLLWLMIEVGGNYVGYICRCGDVPDEWFNAVLVNLSHFTDCPPKYFQGKQITLKNSMYWLLIFIGLIIRWCRSVASIVRAFTMLMCQCSKPDGNINRPVRDLRISSFGLQ